MYRRLVSALAKRGLRCTHSTTSTAEKTIRDFMSSVRPITPEDFRGAESPRRAVETTSCIGWPIKQCGREDRAQSEDLDATESYDWSPADVNRNDRAFTVDLRYNEAFPVTFHNTVSFGYVRKHLSPNFRITGAPSFKTEQGVELNTLPHVTPSLMELPVLQCYANIGGGVANLSCSV